MSPVLFLFVMQGFLDTLQLDAQPVQFSYFPENKNGNLATCKGRLLGQNTAAKGTTFDFRSSFYVDDSFFIFSNKPELSQALIKLNKHFARFGLTMHIGSSTTKSKTECMFFPAYLNLAIDQAQKNLLPENFSLPDNSQIHFVNKFKYLGSIITPLLNEDAEIESRIKKAKAIMGASKHFFDNKDVDRRVKTQIYIAGPLNALLWGCESWNLTKRNLNKLRSFHHGTIRRILSIKWQQVRDNHIKNAEVRALLYNIPNIDAFIARRTANYIGKVSRSNETTFPKKFLAAWINKSRKNGAPQLTCNNNYAKVIAQILPKNCPLSNNQAPLKEWIPLARNATNWQSYIDNYFESCRFVDPDDDDLSDSTSINSASQ